MAKRLSKKEFAKQKQTEMKETIQKAMGDVAWHMDSPEGVKEYLDFMAKMHDYSPRNQMLLQNQYKGAHGVAGKKHFEEMGFNIREGEKPLQVLAPVFKKYTIDKDDKWIPLNRPTKDQQKKIDSGEYKVKQKLHYYRFADVYDLGQTDAKTEDYPKLFPNRPFQFDEKALNNRYPDLKVSMKQFAEKQGFHLKDEQTTERLGNAKGGYYPDSNVIRMRPQLSDGEYISTLNHEIAHGQLHRESTLDTPTKELEAEMTAYVTNKHFGLDTSEKSISYMASWTENLSTLDDKETFKVIERVSQASRSMIDGIEQNYQYQNDLEHQKRKDFNLRDNRSAENSLHEAPPSNEIYQDGEKFDWIDIVSEKNIKDMKKTHPKAFTPEYGENQLKVLPSEFDNYYLLYEKSKEQEIQVNDSEKQKEVSTLRIGDMRFDYQNIKSDDLKDFTVLKDADHLGVEFESGEAVDFYKNTSDKRAFNKAYKSLPNNKENTIENYVQYGLNNDTQAKEQTLKTTKKKQNSIER